MSDSHVCAPMTWAPPPSQVISHGDTGTYNQDQGVTCAKAEQMGETGDDFRDEGEHRDLRAAKRCLALGCCAREKAALELCPTRLA